MTAISRDAAAGSGRRRSVPAVLSHGFRPFFLLAALAAALMVPAWLAMFAHGLAPAGPLDPLAWHAHEMVWGYLAAVIAGFLLTAIPNWTGRLPVAGPALALLVALWLAWRLALLLLPYPVWAAAIDLAFLPVLLLAALREVQAAGNRRNLPVVGLIGLFAAGNLVFHLEPWLPFRPGAGIDLALAVAALLIALIGGRIIPSFTHNWMNRRGLRPRPVPFGTFDKAVLAGTGIALVAWLVAPEWRGGGVLLLAAAAAHLARLARWQGHRCLRDPLLAVLHLGYLWLAVSLGLMGMAAVVPDLVPASAALHALTAGAIGTMTLAVMTRASLGHTGRALQADGWTTACYALVTLGAVARVAAPWCGADYLPALMLGGTAWAAGFGLFALRYAPILLGPRKAKAEAAD